MSLQTETLESIKLDVKQHLIWKTNTPAVRSSKTDKSMYTNQQNQQTDTNQTNRDNRDKQDNKENQDNKEKLDNRDNIDIDTRRLNVDLQIQSRREKSLCTNPFMINNNYLDDIKIQDEFLRPQKTYTNN